MNNSTAQKLLSKVRDDYNQIADRFSATREKLWPEFYFFKKYVRDSDRILDIGCGNGRLYKLFQDLSMQKPGFKINYLGIDNSENLITEAKRKWSEQLGGNMNFSVGSVLDLSFIDRQVDVVFLIAVLQHIPGKDLRIKALKNIYNKLKPGGYLIMSNWNLWQKKYIAMPLQYSLNKIFRPNREVVEGVTYGELDFGDIFITWHKGKVRRYYHAFNTKELKSLLREAGFTILFHDYSDKINTGKVNTKRNIITIAQKI